MKCLEHASFATPCGIYSPVPRPEVAYERLPDRGIVIDDKGLSRFFTHGALFMGSREALSTANCNRKKLVFVTKCGFGPIWQHFDTNRTSAEIVRHKLSNVSKPLSISGYPPPRDEAIAQRKVPK